MMKEIADEKETKVIISRACCNRTRDNGFKTIRREIKAGREEEFFYSEGGKILDPDSMIL